MVGPIYAGERVGRDGCEGGVGFEPWKTIAVDHLKDGRSSQREPKGADHQRAPICP